MAFKSHFQRGASAHSNGDAKADGLALVTWLFKTQLIEALENEIDAIADDTAALSEGDRAKLLGEVERDMLAVEREEEFFIRAANDEGALCAADAMLIRSPF